jgi:wyosine [tRNA(Phe)-imidazoG37] synthetase (radical SAM superfamily)
MTNTRQSFFKVDDILNEFQVFLKKDIPFDIVTIVGEGEPTLYADLENLILGIKKIVDKPVAVISNGGLLYDKDIQFALNQADIVLPTLDAYDEQSFKKINRPIGQLSFQKVYQGLVDFSNQYKGQLWLEMMFVKNMNDSNKDIRKLQEKLEKVSYDRLYLNTPVRPPAESFVECVSKKKMQTIASQLSGISIDLLVSEGFYSEIRDDIEAIKSIIKRHPMNQYEIHIFLEKRGCVNIHDIMQELGNADDVEKILYKNFETYRLK